MSDRSTADRHIARAAEQRARSPVLSQAGNEKYATGCGNLSMPSNHLDRQIDGTMTRLIVSSDSPEIRHVSTPVNYKVWDCKSACYVLIFGSK